jgi:hypothetical protein
MWSKGSVAPLGARGDRLAFLVELLAACVECLSKVLGISMTRFPEVSKWVLTSGAMKDD